MCLPIKALVVKLFLSTKCRQVIYGNWGWGYELNLLRTKIKEKELEMSFKLRCSFN
jgi:hypothetical protein